jgi:hypothetical protein
MAADQANRDGLNGANTMSEGRTEQSLVDSLRTDIAQAVSLYFAPVRAVVREFNEAVSANGDARESRSAKERTRPA